MPITATNHEIPHRFHPSILREYDIRGVVDETLFEADAYFIGRGFASALIASGVTNPTVAVARDGRLSSPALIAALKEGLKASGARVIDCGLGPTPMLYFAVHHLNADGGIMVTGSHNPPTHNGFKMMKGKSSFFGAEIQALGNAVQSNRLAHGTGSESSQSVHADYTTALMNEIKSLPSVAAAWDAGNGAAGEIVEAICAKLTSQHTLFTTIDGTFPNHHPDPSVPENLRDIMACVINNKCKIGLAFDGDGDRLGVVDDKGRMVASDHLLMLLARDVLATKKGTIIADVKTSQLFFDDVTAHGGEALMWKTGHSHIKSKMKEVSALFAGEASGHLFFMDRYFGFDDGLYAAMRMLRIVATSPIPLSDMVDALPRACSTPEIRIACADDRKFIVVDEIRDRLSDSGADFIALDGVRVNTPHGWWLVRASNTQPVINARCEATNKADLALLVETLRDYLAKSGVALMM